MTINALTSLGRAVIGFVAFFSLVHLSGFAGQNPADENAIRNVVEGYLKAKNWKERLVFVQDPGKQEAAMQKKYQGAEFQLQNPAVQRIDEMDKLPGKYLVKASWTEKLKNQGFTLYYVVGKGPEGFKIDWRASVGYNSVSLKLLVMQKSKGPHTLRLIATADSKYVDDYANAAGTHFCFVLKEDIPLKPSMGTFPRTMRMASVFRIS